jgi:hypothetical protein
MGLNIDVGTVYAKILVKENIEIVQADVETAYFNLDTRVLTIPFWNMSKQLYYMLLAHECAHAKYTPSHEWFAAIKEFESDFFLQRIFQSTLNVVEDARIDKLIMRHYPGVRKDYHKGHQEMKDMDFFRLKESDKTPAEYGFVDRINIHFKSFLLPHHEKFDIPFSEEELVYIDRISNVEKFDEVIEISKELMQFCKEEIATLRSKLQEKVKGQKEESAKALIENEELDEETKKLILELLEDFFNLIASSIKESVDKDSSIGSIQVKSAKNYDSGYGKQSLSIKIPWECLDKITEYNPTDNVALPFVKNNNVINTMVMEFERRKAAKKLQRSLSNETGYLDTKKLYQYKYNNNIFKVNQTEYIGKNHGFVFLIDWSSSMKNVYKPLLKQLYMFASFCKKTNVPFEAYIFKDGKQIIIENLNSFELKRLFTNKNTLFQIEKSIANLSTKYSDSPSGGTPLSEALVAMIPVIQNFKVKSRTDIVNFVLFSDGGCNHYAAKNAMVTCREMGIAKVVGSSFIHKVDFTSVLLKMLKYIDNLKSTVYYLDEEEITPIRIFENKGGADTVFHIQKDAVFNGNPQHDLFLSKNLIKAMA